MLEAKRGVTVVYCRLFYTYACIPTNLILSQNVVHSIKLSQPKTGVESNLVRRVFFAGSEAAAKKTRRTKFDSTPVFGCESLMLWTTFCDKIRFVGMHAYV